MVIHAAKVITWKRVWNVKIYDPKYFLTSKYSYGAASDGFTKSHVAESPNRKKLTNSRTRIQIRQNMTSSVHPSSERVRLVSAITGLEGNMIGSRRRLKGLRNIS